MIRLEDVQRLLAVVRLEHLVTALAYCVRGQRAHEGVIVGNEGFHDTMTTRGRVGYRPAGINASTGVACLSPI